MINQNQSADIDNKITTKQNSNQENPPNHFSSLPPKATADPTQNLVPPKKQSAVVVPNQTVIKNQFPNIPTIQITVPNENNTEQSDNNKPNIKTGEANSEKQQNKEIVIGKLKAAIFAAAALESEKNRVNINGMNYNPPKFGVNTAKGKVYFYFLSIYLSTYQSIFFGYFYLYRFVLQESMHNYISDYPSIHLSIHICIYICDQLKIDCLFLL